VKSSGNQAGPVLVVDDEKSIRISLREFLVADGYTVEVAADAQEAQRLLGDHDFDVVVSDIVLPGISGIELLQAIRSAAPYVQVIMMTGDPTIATAAAALRSGAFDYLIKPAGKNAILRAVGNAVTIKKLDDERRREQEAKVRYQQELQEVVICLTAANEQLRQAAAFREEVEHIVRHDLKSPLSIIIGAPELIRMMPGKLTEEQSGWLQNIESAGHRMLDMINRSLDLFKIEQGMYTLRLEAVDLLSVTQEVISHNATLMRAKNLAVDIMVDDHPCTKTDVFVVQGERLLCYSMLGNLLKNALEASPTGESVTFRFKSDDPMVVSLRNQGSVPESIRDRFFKKFSTAGKTHGAGLGAYSARLIAELHGARISVDTSVPDFTTVVIGFPGHAGAVGKECGA
jgi:two-component system sensor histidine kinase/response regulator